jgi:hypothetical protein
MCVWSCILDAWWYVSFDVVVHFVFCLHSILLPMQRSYHKHFFGINIDCNLNVH